MQQALPLEAERSNGVEASRVEDPALCSVQAVGDVKCPNFRTQYEDAERSRWRCLGTWHVAGNILRRNHLLGRYIMENVCLEARLVIEVDRGPLRALALRSGRDRPAPASGLLRASLLEPRGTGQRRAERCNGAFDPHPNLPPARGKGQFRGPTKSRLNDTALFVLFRCRVASTSLTSLGGGTPPA